MGIQKTKDGSGSSVSDDAWDALQQGFTRATKAYLNELGRKPTLDELLHLTRSVLCGLLPQLSSDAEKYVLLDLNAKTGKAVKPKVGDIFAVPLESGGWGYGKFLINRGQFTCLGFYDVKTEQIESPWRLRGRAYAFRKECGLGGLVSGRWPVLANEPPSAEEAEPPKFQYVDPIDDAKVYLVTIDARGEAIRRKARRQDVEGLSHQGLLNAGSAEVVLTKLLNGEKVIL